MVSSATGGEYNFNGFRISQNVWKKFLGKAMGSVLIVLQTFLQNIEGTFSERIKTLENFQKTYIACKTHTHKILLLMLLFIHIARSSCAIKNSRLCKIVICFYNVHAPCQIYAVSMSVLFLIIFITAVIHIHTYIERMPTYDIVIRGYLYNTIRALSDEFVV